MLKHYNDSKIFAILGPTNTGKTHLAFERLISYQSGVFGFPLRLLARENYDKAIGIVGANKVALITGEEKIVPSNPKYFFCTVESMPANISAECVAIDEVQLSSDFERGHIFTDRILHYRGSLETILLGSSTIRFVLKKLFPDILNLTFSGRTDAPSGRLVRSWYSPAHSLSSLSCPRCWRSITSSVHASGTGSAISCCSFSATRSIYMARVQSYWRSPSRRLRTTYWRFSSSETHIGNACG